MNTIIDLITLKKNKRHFLRWICLSLLIVALDQISKYFILNLNPEQPIAITSFFNLTLLFNRGAAFSFLSSASGWQNIFFAVIAILVSLIVVRWLYQITENRISLKLSLSLILGGALGNLIDRIIRGNVIDFLDFYYQNWHWPAFNLADSAIVIGILLMLIDMLIFDKNQ